MKKFQKIVEYFQNLCYYNGYKSLKKMEVIDMPDVVIKGIYNEMCNFEVSQKSKTSFFDLLYYYFKLKKIAKKVDWSLYISEDKKICNGDAVIKGTRIKPETILNYYLKLCKTQTDANERIIFIKKAYPTLGEKEISLSILYMVKKKGIRFII